ncbi:hypothetical protein K3495_g4363 [Podosphaera aphanis]|nr:hypothetical protein K3495_g4363 [Podosphaera aphanis]
MDSPPVTQLSRAVSAVDLNASLSAVREQPDDNFRYANKVITNIQSNFDYEKPGDSLDSSSPDGILTPPNHAAPNPPPPTPATPDLTLNNIQNSKVTAPVSDEILGAPEGEEAIPTPNEIQEGKEIAPEIDEFSYEAQIGQETTLMSSDVPCTQEGKETVPGVDGPSCDAQIDHETTLMPDEDSDTLEAPKKKKKKKKKKGKSAGQSDVAKKPAPSGFEEFFADSPIRPDEYDEERELYNKSHAFKDRIETCIQRFRARRKLDQVRANVFTKYLALGGINTGPKQFTGGLDKETIENSTTDEVIAFQATDYIHTGQENPKFFDGSDKWVVDFEGVVKGFFSQELPSRLPIESKKQLQSYGAVIRNFLNYILHHEVCPEFTEDIMAARKIIDKAEDELWAIQEMPQKLPGDFNVAASILYGGHYYNPWGFGCWEEDDPDYSEYPSTIKGFSRIQAARIVQTGIAFSGDRELFTRFKNTEVKICNSETKYFEVVKIQPPDPQVVAHQKNITADDEDLAKIKPLGTVTFKYWEGPNMGLEDCTDDEDETDAPKSEKKARMSQTETYLLEEEALAAMFLGLKLEVIVIELNIGLKFIDSVVSLNCSFYTFLPNKRMFGYKVPAPSAKPPPTEEDPDRENEFLAKQIEEEMQ